MQLEEVASREDHRRHRCHYLSEQSVIGNERQSKRFTLGT